MSTSSDSSDDDSFSLSSFSFSSEGSISDGSDAGANATPYAAREDPRCHYLLADFSEWMKEDVAVLTDFALAAHNGAMVVFNSEENRYYPFMCGRHGGGGWLVHGDQVKFFADRDKNLKRMCQDFNIYVRSPFVSAIPFLQQLMLDQWISYGEHVIAEKWEAQWANTLHTYVEANRMPSNKLGGGLPIMNNGVEGTNNGDKNWFDNRKPMTATFVEDLAVMLENRSKQDLMYAPTLNKEVHCRDFYAHVYEILERSGREEATCLTVQFPFKSNALGYIEGTVLVASTRFLDGRKSDPNTAAVQTIRHFKDDLVSNGCDRQWISSCHVSKSAEDCKFIIQQCKLHSQYKTFVKGPEAFATRVGLAFGDATGMQHMFHVMEPIVFDYDDVDDRACIHNFRKLLKRMELKPISARKIAALGANGLMMCSCEVYLQRAWCKHSCCVAFKRGIIQQYPPRMNPKPTIENKQQLVGALTKSRPGEALNRFG